MIVPVILSGGVGSRLWPLSREEKPKQFIPFLNKYSLIQNTILRLEHIKDLTAPVIVCNQAHRFLMLEQLEEINIVDADIILEPLAKNTAPAIALAALYVEKKYPGAIMLVLPADHHLNNIDIFSLAVANARVYARQGKLVTFGVEPTEPHTGYGYIMRSEAIGVNHGFKVQKFIEKPCLFDANLYVNSGNYVWNSGMFIFQASTFLSYYSMLETRSFNACQKALKLAKIEGSYIYVDKAAFSQVRRDSIDYAIMEKVQEVVVIPLSCQWSDIGSWKSLSEISSSDEAGNCIEGRVYLEGSEGCYVHSSNKKKVVALIGVKNQVVVETDDALLILDKKSAESLKHVLEVLKSSKDAKKSGAPKDLALLSELNPSIEDPASSSIPAVRKNLASSLVD